MNFFIERIVSDPYYFFTVAVVVLFSVSLHEYFHAQTALWEGDSTAADAGHLTLNPLKQMGLFSLVMFCIIGICWGSVPVNPSRFRGRWSNLKVSLAGPAANLLILSVSWVAFGLLANREVPPGLLSLLFYFGLYNFVLLVINLLPAPGLDGWEAVCEFVPSARGMQSEMLKGFMVFVVLAAFFFIGYFYKAGIIFMSLSVKLLG